MKHTTWKFSLLGVALAACGLVSVSATAAPVHGEPPPITRLIVKFKPFGGVLPAEAKGNAFAMTTTRMESLAAAAGLPLSYQRAMSGNAHVVNLPYAMVESEAAAIAAQISNRSDVEYAEPDAWMFPAAVPNDTYYSYQWHYMAPATNGDAGAANLPAAWDITTGSTGVVVAVLDTGVLNHVDLRENLVGGSAAASGYDLISYSSAANSGDAGSNDGDGRDSDPTDPGDWVRASEPNCGGASIKSSSWHGTHVAGTIGARGNNGIGVTGVAWNTKLLTVRVLGSCGGLVSDIADGIAWAAGEAVTGVPANSNPAKVINMSLGGSGSCGPTYQNAIDAVVAQGATVVVAAGNSNAAVGDHRPANCNNVVTVAALNRAGGRSYYSNYDSSSSYIALAAPGGDVSGAAANGVASTLDTGTTTANNDDAYVYYQGTSMATPHVSGIVALMLAANSKLTDGTIAAANVSGLIKAKLQASVRAFPTGTGSDCTTSTCGAGMVDAEAAVRAVSTAPDADAGDAQSVAPGATVNLSANESTDDGSIASYAWTQTAGVSASLTGANTATPSFTAPATAQTMTFRLTVTDDVALTDTDQVTVTVIPPAPSALTAADNGVGGIVLTWADNSQNEVGFKVERRLVGTGSYVQIATLAANATGYTDTTVTVGASYDYQAYAYHSGANSGYSNTATTTVTSTPAASSSGGGGGSIGWLALALLFAPLLRRRMA